MIGPATTLKASSAAATLAVRGYRGDTSLDNKLTSRLGLAAGQRLAVNELVVAQQPRLC